MTPIPPRTRESLPSSNTSTWKEWFKTSFTNSTVFPSKTKCEDAPLPPPPLPSSPSTANESPVAPPPLESSTDDDKMTASIFPNPGFYEHAPLEVKAITSLDTFDGFRCDINKQLSPFMAVVHSFWLGTSMIPERNKTYTFVTQVAGDNGLFMARVDPERKTVDGKIHTSVLNPATTLKVSIAVSEEGQQDQLLTELDINGDTWTGNLKYGSMGGGSLLGCNYLQNVTRTIALGGEGMYIASNQAMLTSYLAKYSSSNLTPDAKPSPSTCMVANYSPAQGQLSLLYKRVVTPNRVTLGAELTCFPMMSPESTVSFGAEFQLLRSKMNLSVDGNGKVSSLLEAKLGTMHGSPSLNFSGELDYAKDTMKFGYGITLGG